MPAHLIAEEGPHRGLILNLEEGDEWIIGRDPESAAFVIEDTTVSRRHAQLRKAPEGILLENLSKVNPALVNDEPLDGEVLLKEGDRIQVGHTVFLYSEEELPEIGSKQKKERSGGYDDIFGSLDEPAEDLPIGKKEDAEERSESKSSAYDTIFEDSHEDSQLPFNLLSVTPLILKVISGPNAGAEIGMEKGRSYTIGKDADSCDIVFQDLSVSRNHARISIGPEGAAEIEDLGSKNGTAVNGVPITEKRSITPQDLVALGTTVFLIIDREAPQETIYSPMMPTYEPAKIESEREAEEQEEQRVEIKRDWRKERIPTKHLIAAGSIAAIFLIAFLSFFSLFKSNTVDTAVKEPSGAIKKALAKFSDVQYSFNPASGKLFLVGHVLTAVDYQEMRYRIGELPFVVNTEDNVVIDESVDKIMNDVLSSNELFRGVVIKSPEAGKFVVAGYIDTNAGAMQLAEYLAVNFPYLDRLENKVAVGEMLNTQIQGLLQMNGFGALTFQYVGGELILAGNYSNKMEGEFKTVVKKLDTLPGISHVRNYAVASSPNQAAIDITQQFQVSGLSQFEGHGYSVVLNGKIYTLGDAVAGMQITEIDKATILLEKDGIKYRINYTR